MSRNHLAALAVLAFAARAAAAPLAAPLAASVLVDGAPLRATEAARLKRVNVEQVANGSDSCLIELEDGRGQSPGMMFEVGAALEVRVGAGRRAQTLFKGEVVAIEPIFDTHGDNTVVVRGFDLLHRLNRGRRTKTWENASDADVVSRIADEHGLLANAAETGWRSDFIYQNNQSDLDFLRARAARAGFELDVDDHTVLFRSTPDPSADPTVEITDIKVPLRLVTSRVPGPLEVTVRGWDPKQKGPISGRALGDSQQSGPGASYVFDRADALSEEPVLSEGLLFSQAEADDIAQAALQEVAAHSTMVEGEVRGNPQLKAGIVVKLVGIDQRFDGKYKVVAVQHRFSSGGYVTQFRVRRNAEKG